MPAKPSKPTTPAPSKTKAPKPQRNLWSVLAELKVDCIPVSEPLPKDPAALADLLYKTREARLLVQKVTEELEEQEKAAKEWFINNLPKSQTGVAGQVARVTVDNTKFVPRVANWNKFYAYVARTKAWDLLQRRVSEKAVVERWDDKKEVPGVEKFNLVTVSCVKAGGKK